MRCEFMYKLRVAQDNRAEEALYFPHNVDFRGRAYTMHPHLNHLGADYCRGLLMFAEQRPLGERGLRWIRIQVRAVLAHPVQRARGADASPCAPRAPRQIANLYGGGVDKLPLDKREAYVLEHLDDVVDSATDPLGGRRWWQKAEDPWQCLAACFELTKAMQSPDPAAFLSGLPVQQARRTAGQSGLTPGGLR